MTDIMKGLFVVSDDAVESAVGDETVILHLVNGTYYGLDPVGTKIWNLIKAEVSTTDMCQKLAKEFDVDLETIEADVSSFLTELLSEGILVAA